MHCAEYWDDVSKILLQYCIRGREKTSYLLNEIAFDVFSTRTARNVSASLRCGCGCLGDTRYDCSPLDPRVASTLRHSRAGVEAEVGSCQRLGLYLGKARRVIQSM